MPGHVKEAKVVTGANLEELQNVALSGEALKHYVKAIRGRLAVEVINPFTGEQETKVLKGDITDPEVDEETYIVPLYTDYDAKFFERTNKKLINEGKVIPYTPEAKEQFLVNAITDEEIEEALNKKFFAVKALLDKFTSPVPVERMLRIAKQMDKTVGTVNAIEQRLYEMQEEEYTSGE